MILLIGVQLMKLDKYTRIILTVIAVNLTIQSLSKIDFINSATAQYGSNAQKVTICDASGSRCGGRWVQEVELRSR